MPAFEVVPYHRIVPDWVREVLSLRTREYDVTEKRDVYARHGVGHLWFLDPDARTLEAFALDGGSWRLVGAARGEAEVRGPVRRHRHPAGTASGPAGVRDGRAPGE